MERESTKVFDPLENISVESDVQQVSLAITLIYFCTF